MVLTRVLPLILMAGVAIPGLSQSRIVARVEERIAGGRPATYREFPFQVAILDRKMKQICGGSLISPLEVLTAAHCLDGEKVSHLSVIAGSLTSRLPYSATHQVRKIAKAFVHRHYHSEGYDYDIAILRLNCSFDIQASDGCIKTIDLPKEHYTVRGFVIICGYGAKKPDGSSRNTLYTTVMKVLSDEKCWFWYEEVYKKENIVNDYMNSTMFCAISDDKSDSCGNDSGGPVVQYRRGNYVLVGVIAWGVECGNPKYPGVYMEVSSFLRWIADHSTVQI